MKAGSDDMNAGIGFEPGADVPQKRAPALSPLSISYTQDPDF